MIDMSVVCRELGMELVGVVDRRRGSVLLKARRNGGIVAVKGYDPDETDTYDRQELLRAEAAILREVDPFLSQQLYVSYNTDPTLGDWLVMRWVEGVTVSTYVRDLPEDKTGPLAEVFRAGADALDRVHEAGFLHGDVQPAHLIISGDGLSPVLIDWGLGRRSNTPTPYAGGFVHYAAPEVAAAMLEKRVDIAYTRAAEIYSFGALMAFCYTGETATNYSLSDPLPQKLEKVAQGNLRPFGKLVTEKERQLVSVIRHCLAFHPEDRPASLREVSTGLANLL